MSPTRRNRQYEQGLAQFNGLQMDRVIKNAVTHALSTIPSYHVGTPPQQLGKNNTKAGKAAPSQGKGGGSKWSKQGGDYNGGKGGKAKSKGK